MGWEKDFSILSILADTAAADNNEGETLSKTLILPVEAATRLSIDLFVSLGMSEADAAASAWPPKSHPFSTNVLSTCLS